MTQRLLTEKKTRQLMDDFFATTVMPEGGTVAKGYGIGKNPNSHKRNSGERRNAIQERLSGMWERLGPSKSQKTPEAQLAVHNARKHLFQASEFMNALNKTKAVTHYRKARAIINSMPKDVRVHVIGKRAKSAYRPGMHPNSHRRGSGATVVRQFNDGAMMARVNAPDAPADLSKAAKIHARTGLTAAGRQLDKRAPSDEEHAQRMVELMSKIGPHHNMSLNDALKVQKRMPETITMMDRHRTLTNLKTIRAYLHEKVTELGGSIGRDKKVHIIMGLPGSGKSKLAESIQKKERSMIIDSDELKERIPEFKGGLGANAVHAESSAMLGVVQRRMIREGNNFILPLVGKSPSKLAKAIRELKDSGYHVTLHHVDVPNKFSQQRVAERFLNTGRAVSPVYARDIGNKTRQAFDILRKQNVAHSFSSVSSHNIPGPPKIRYGVLWSKNYKHPE